MSRTSSLSRRDLFRAGAAVTVGLSQSSWLQGLASGATTSPERKKSVIVLWLSGGPSTIDMWDLKTGNANGGPYQGMNTSVAGIRISEHLPRVAQEMKDIAIIRSMKTKEGDHGRATFLGVTGYVPQGALQFPAIGSLVAKELGDTSADLPGYVSVASRRNASIGGGFLGPRYSPLMVGDGRNRNPAGAADEGTTLKVPNLARPEGVTESSQRNRLELLERMEANFEPGKNSRVVETMRSATAQAVSLMRPQAAKTFDLSEENDKLRDTYGRTQFGQGCLLARRLVERGVPFVEVTLDGWDTHQGNFDRVKTLSTTLDNGFAALLTDLRERGMLDSTLVLCMGEFGRTPKINGTAGRDHWPHSWSTVLAGGGIRGGQTIGKTSDDGMTVEDRPVAVPDLIATVCKAVGIDPMKQNISNVSRPIRIADPTAKPISEVL
ncbi:DUF1501 domain-containing protein [Anatilimnocola sp. NA78]|uniref:DUF1501 domain-containing protein n=1 Tax=Anatilimnocola sp. NA78 TaxID=3415683 RepID=UPI003CE45852